MGVTGGGEDLEDAVVDREERHIKGSATKIVYDDLRLAALLVQPVGDGGRGRLIDDPEDGKPGDGAGVLGRLALGVVEV
jgi:hypothetical protein